MPKQLCPLIREECSGHACTWYTHLMGQNPQTGEMIDKWDCAITLMPVLMVETSKNARETAARVDQFRELATQVVRSTALNKPTEELKALIGVKDS